MRPGSPQLDDALAAGQRHYTMQARLGGRDVTDQVDSWSVDRAFESGLPDQVAAPAGSDSAQAKLSLSGDGTATAAQMYSPWAPRSTADVTRPGQSAVLTWGLGGENLQAMRGRLTSVSASAATGAADVNALDGAELLRGAAWLPPAGEFLGTRTHAQWVVDHALRESGIYTSPPARSGHCFFASLQGGFQANAGMLLGVTGSPGFYPARSPWTAGPGGDQFSEYERWTATWAPRRRVLSQVNQLLVEWWFYRRTTTDNPDTGFELVFADRPEGVSGYSPRRVSASYNPATRQMSVASTGASSSWWTLPESVNQAGRFKVVLQVGLTTTTDPVTVRGWLYQPDGSLYATPSTYYGGAPNWGLLERITASATGPMECLGVTPISGTVQVVEPWTRGASIDLMTSGGIGYLGTTYCLTALPEVSGTWWDVIKSIASDTMSYVGFDEDGYFRMRRYDYIEPGDPAPPDVEVTSRRDIADLTVSEEAGGVRNRVEVAVSSERVYTSPTEQFGYASVTSISAGGTARVQFDFQGRPWQIRTPMFFTGSSIPAGNVGSMVKFMSAVGNLAPVEVEMRYDEGNPVVIYHNRGVSTAYAALSSTVGPSLRLAHGTSEDTRLSPTIRENPSSIARFGRHALSVSESDWVQNRVFADALARQLIVWTAWPIPMTGQVDVLPDPRIQLGDVVRVVDPGGVRVNRLFRVLGYRVSGSGGEVQMSLDLRPIEVPESPVDAGLTVEPVLDPAVAPSLPG